MYVDQRHMNWLFLICGIVAQILDSESSSFSPGGGIAATRDDALFYHTLENQIRYSPDGGATKQWFET